MSGVVGFVSARHAWLKPLYADMRRKGLAIRDAVLADGALRLSLEPRGASPLTLVIRSRREELPAWGTTERHSLGFEGAADLTRAEEGALSRALDVLTAHEATIPPRLDGFSALIIPSGEPDRDLARLFAFLDVERSRTPTDDIVEVLVRVTSKCNQACPFCSAPQHDRPSSETLLACFSAVSRLLPGATLTLTGGEPTIRPRFLDEVKTARAQPGIGRVNVQTNAVLFADRADPAALEPGSDVSFFVSLHAVDQTIYDACTGSRGQLPAALAGIQRLLGAGHDVTLNTVVTRDNLAHLDALVRALPGLLPVENRPALHFSALMCPERRPQAEELLVRYAELAPAVQRAAALAKELGFRVESLLSSTHASLPACTVPGLNAAERPAPALGTHETGYGDTDTPWVKADTCRDCRETAHCLGVSRPYARRFGLEELVPLGTSRPGGQTPGRD